MQGILSNGVVVDFHFSSGVRPYFGKVVAVQKQQERKSLKKNWKIEIIQLRYKNFAKHAAQGHWKFQWIVRN